MSDVDLKATTAQPDVPGQAKDEDAEAKAKRWLEMNGGDQAKANARALEFNNRLAKDAKDGKTPPATEEPPAEPAPVEVSAEEITTKVKASVAADADCQRFIRDFQVADKRLKEIVEYTDSGVPKDGELVRLSRRLATIEGYLDPEKAGIENAPVLDELQREELVREKEKAEGVRERLLSEYARLEARAESITDKYSKRIQGIKSSVERKAQVEAQAAKQDETYEADHAAATDEWKTALDEILKDEKDAVVRADIEERLLLKANATYDAGKQIPVFRTWMAPEVARIRDIDARKAGLTSTELARLKDRDASTPAPRGAAAVAAASSPSSADLLSPRDARKAAERRASERARSIRVVQS